jgi:hypothetical protein
VSIVADDAPPNPFKPESSATSTRQSVAKVRVDGRSLSSDLKSTPSRKVAVGQGVLQTLTLCNLDETEYREGTC